MSCYFSSVDFLNVSVWLVVGYLPSRSLIFFFVLVSGNQLDLIETKTKLPQTFIEEFHKVTAMY